MKTFFVSDLHGAYRGLIQALDKAKYDSSTDKLIIGGDICDGWSETKEIIDFLLTIENKIVLMGNHDEMALFYYLSKRHYIFDDGTLEYSSWKTKLAGDSTVKSIGDKSNIDPKYLDFLSNMQLYYEHDNKLFVHAGINIDTEIDVKDQDPYYLLWEDVMINHIQKHREHKIGKWSEIFVGHTPVQIFNEFYTRPKNFGNVWACDTAAGFIGKVSVIDIDSKEVFQSEQVRKLYPDEKGRNKTTYNQDINGKFS